jgi:hypothetical protein
MLWSTFGLMAFLIVGSFILDLSPLVLTVIGTLLGLLAQRPVNTMRRGYRELKEQMDRIKEEG